MVKANYSNRTMLVWAEECVAQEVPYTKISHSGTIFRYRDYGNGYGHPFACEAVADGHEVNCDFSEFD